MDFEKKNGWVDFKIIQKFSRQTAHSLKKFENLNENNNIKKWSY